MNKSNKKKEITIRSSCAEYLTYISAVGDDADSIEMRYEDENIWLTQKMMAELYGVETNTINEHIKKVYEDSELKEDSTIRKFRIVQNEGNRQVSRDVNHYNLQMIIAVGFKVNNERAVQFRKWANTIVKEYTIKGFVLDDERLKNGGTILTKEYFNVLLERIREIRLSERKFYQKITDIYATSIDYDKDSKTTKEFFAKVQNKMHFATLNNALYAVGALYILNIYYEFHKLDTIDTFEYKGQYEYTFDSHLFFVEMYPNYLTYSSKMWYYRFLLLPTCAEQINKYVLLQTYSQDEFNDLCNEHAQASRMMGYYIDTINDKDIIEKLKNKKITCNQAGTNYSRRFNDIIKKCIKHEVKNIRLIVSTLSFKDNKFNENELKRVLNEIYGNNPYIDSNLKPIDVTELCD